MRKITASVFPVGIQHVYANLAAVKGLKTGKFAKGALAAHQSIWHFLSPGVFQHHRPIPAAEMEVPVLN